MFFYVRFFSGETKFDGSLFDVQQSCILISCIFTDKFCLRMVCHSKTFTDQNLGTWRSKLLWYGVSVVNRCIDSSHRASMRWWSRAREPRSVGRASARRRWRHAASIVTTAVPVLNTHVSRAMARDAVTVMTSSRRPVRLHACYRENSRCLLLKLSRYQRCCQLLF